MATDLEMAVIGFMIERADRPLTERLTALQIAWIVFAKQARDEALYIPDGFSTEQRRQLDQLAKLARLVREDTPDLELERLIHEEDWQGVIAYTRKLQEGGA